MNVTPRQVHRRAVRIAMVSGPSTLLVATLWGLRALLPNRPVLVLMVFMVLLCITAAACIVLVAASLHLAVARAFAAGLRAGGAKLEGDRRHLSVLRLVE